MLRYPDTILLVWGLFDDSCCSAKPLTVQSQSSAPLTTLDGWNSPSSLLLCNAASPVKQISLSWTHVLLLTERGAAYVASASQVLQQARAHTGSHALQPPPVTSTGTGNTSSIWQPVQLLSSSLCRGAPASVSIKQVSAGDQHCLLLDCNGCVWAMGSNQYGQLGLSPQLAAATAAISATAAAAAAADADAASDCELGRHVSSFVAVLGPNSGGDVREPVKQVAAGACHSVAITASLGRLFAWGWNAHGQCGTGRAADVQQPTLCTALDGVPLASVAAGMAHTVAASRDGAVYAWGCGSDGQLGHGEPAVADEDGPPGARDGAHCGAGTRSSGDVGSAGAKQQPRSTLLPVLVEDAELDMEDVVQVACGSRHTVALTASGRVFAWGLNTHGQCCTAAAAQGASCTGAAEAEAAAAVVTSALGQHTSFEVQTITAPRAAVKQDTVWLPGTVQEAGVAGMEGEDVTATQAGAESARKLVKCGKAVAVRAGRWHTMIELELSNV